MVDITIRPTRLKLGKEPWPWLIYWQRSQANLYIVSVTFEQRIFIWTSRLTFTGTNVRVCWRVLYPCTNVSADVVSMHFVSVYECNTQRNQSLLCRVILMLLWNPRRFKLTTTVFFVCFRIPSITVVCGHFVLMLFSHHVDLNCQWSFYFNFVS